jgi:hypothetical protein
LKSDSSAYVSRHFIQFRGDCLNELIRVGLGLGSLPKRDNL